MFHPARHFMSRWTIRLFFLAIIVSAITWLWISHNGKTMGCLSSEECYEALINTARRISNNAQQPQLQQQLQHQLKQQAEQFQQVQQEEQQEHEREQQEQEQSIAVLLKNQQSPLIQEQAIPNNFLPRVKGAFVALARNREIHAMRSSMRYLEDRYNYKYNYPWIFLNEEPFTDEFKNLTRTMTNAETYYGQVPSEHWGYPDWINQTLAKECRERMVEEGIVYGGSESYRHMCRFQSGFFVMHPLLDGLDYYWRVEPGVKFSCDIEYDPFRVMQERDLKYGFTIALKEFYSTIPTLWDTTLDFMNKNPDYIYPKSNPDSLYNVITQDDGLSYNLCHFWSNFEIGSVSFLRSERYQAYFRHLDQAGGFFYERWGDAPVHSIAVALMLSSKEVHWFYDIGYKHDNFEHCPTEPGWLVHGKCYCDPKTSFDYVDGSCIKDYLQVTNTTVNDYIITSNDDQ